MSLISRIFPNRRNRKQQQQFKGDKINLPRGDQATRGLTPNSRLVLFQDHHDKGKIRLFDSEAIKNIESPQVQKQSSDTKMLGEMMFGSVPMVYKGPSLKVHVIRSPPQLMVTKVFIPNPPQNSHKDGISEPANYDASSLNGSMSESTPKQIDSFSKGKSSVAHSIPVDVPIQKNSQADDEGEEFDSGILTASGGSLGGGQSSEAHPSPGSSRSSSINSSFNSLKRRWTRSQTTSFEHSLRIVFGDELGEVMPLVRQRATKLGLGVIFMLPEDSKSAENRHFQHFFFSHITLIESHINKLVAGIERAVFNKREYFQIIIQTMDHFRKCVDDLYRAPRISNPVWLNMIRYPSKKLVVCQHFLKDFMMLVEKYDTKSTNFFLSTVITSVLTSHLAWVPTVTPTGVCPSRNYVTKHSAKWLDTLAKSHPYNPLWAQLGDLYGALGYPLKLGRTVVIGKKSDLVSKFIHILSYFIRCSEVHENVEQKLTEEFVKTPELTVDFPDSSFGSPDTGGKSSWPTFCASPLDYKSEHFSIDSDINAPVSPIVSPAFGQKWSRPCSRNTNIGTDGQNISESSNTEKCLDESVVAPKLCPTSTECEKRKDSVSQQPQSPQLSPSSPSMLSLRICAMDGGGDRLRENIRDPPIMTDQKCEKSPTLAEENVRRERIRHIGRSPRVVSQEIGERTTSFPFSGDCERLQHISGTLCTCAVGKNLCCSCKDSRPQNCDNKQLLDFVERDLPSEYFKTCVCDKNGQDMVSIESDKCCHSTCNTEDSEEPHTRIPKMIRVPLTFGGTSSSRVSPPSINKLPGSNSEDSHLIKNPGLTAIPCDGKHLDMSKTHVNPPEMNVNEPNNKQIDLHVGNPKTFLRMVSNQSTNSMFDEYFDDNSDPLVKSPTRELAKITFLSKRVTSVESNASLFDEIIDEPIPAELLNGEKNSLKYKGQFTMESDSVMFDEYYNDQSEVLPNVNGDNVLEGTDIGATRPASLSLRLELSGKETTLARHSNLSPTTPVGMDLRRRHVSNKSTTSAISNVSTEGCERLQEIILPKSNIMKDDGSRHGYERNFGCSLLAGVSDHYLSDFVLHGTSDANIETKLDKDLSMALLNPVLDEPISETVCTIANIDDWSVTRKSCHSTQADQHKSTVLAASHLVTSIIESVHDLWKLKMAPEFCLMHLEDRLQEIYFKSQMVAEYICTHSHLEAAQVVSNLGVDLSDLQLLLAVASTQCEGPPVSHEVETT